MKIITKCVIDIETLQVISEESYEYSGSIAECKGGSGGGSGGGSSSGAVSYPAYVETVHSDWINNSGADTLTSSVTDAMNSAYGNSPWTGAIPYDPDADITAYEAAISGFDAIIAGINEPVDWAALFTQAVSSIDGVSDAEITADVVAFAAEQDDQLTTVTLPRFEAGMRDINAVVSSAFAIGKSNIEGFRDRDVARHSSKLRLAIIADRGRLYIEGTSQMMNFLLQKYSWEESYMKVVVEGKRIKLVAKKEESDMNLNIDEKDALWDLEVFQYGGNLLASVAGGVSTPNVDSPSKMQSAIGGALQGAAAGAMMSGGNPYAIAAGAALGAGSAFL